MVKIIEGVIDRRILVNYRIDPDQLAKVLPSPFKPRLISGYAVGGICLIRFKKMRPAGLPSIMGTSSENGTHRFCVEWMEDDQKRSGIYVKQRFTDSRLHEFGGDKIFPGNLTLSAFKVDETGNRYSVSFRSKDGEYSSVQAHKVNNFPSDSIFKNIEEASEDFRKDKVGYSPDKKSGGYKGVRLNTTNWEVTPLVVDSVESSLFSNKEIFPEGTIKVDHSLLMTNIDHNWEDVETICCS